MNSYIADFHIHSYLSRATGKQCKLDFYSLWANLKGIQLVGTGDFTHSRWVNEIEENLLLQDNGLYTLRPELKSEINKQIPVNCQSNVHFIPTSEISCIYKKNNKVRKIHSLIFAPDITTVKKINARLEKIGNIHSDGRPILGLDVKNLLEIVLESHELSFMVPAHIWTPHFSLLGSESGFDTIEECFEDLTPKIFALETGLSSDPAMNWRLSQLDNFSLISNSDAHSPQKLGREANIFYGDMNYKIIKESLQTGENFGGTLEFFPEEGKYHYDGHRLCKVNFAPWETISRQGLCPVCNKKVTVGVMHRVELLSDKKSGEKSKKAKPYESLIPLVEIIGESEKVSGSSKKAQNIYFKLLNILGNELNILRKLSIAEIEKEGFAKLAYGIKCMREGKVQVIPGYDGEYGKIKVFSDFSENSNNTQLKLL